MASAINPALPADGTPAIKANLRTNLAAAKSEIEALQAAGGAGTVGSLGGEMETLAIRAYPLDSYAMAPYTINSLARKCGSGSATGSVQINGTNVTGLSGLAVAVGPFVVTNATAANSVAVGDRVTFLPSANTAALNVELSLKITAI